MEVSYRILRHFFSKFGDRDYCPRRVHEVEVLRACSEHGSSLDRQRYFEGVCIGSPLDGVRVDDLPRHRRNGSKLADHRRIDTMGMEFRAACERMGVYINIYSMNVPLRMPMRDGFILRGDFHVFPTPILMDGVNRVAFLNLKLTSDTGKEFVDRGRYWDHPWGRPDWIDTTEMMILHTLVRSMDNDLNEGGYPPFLYDVARKGLVEGYYWVFGYRKGGFKPIRFVWSEAKEGELKETIRRGLNLIRDHNHYGWKPTPGILCQGCPVECDARMEVLEM